MKDLLCNNSTDAHAFHCVRLRKNHPDVVLGEPSPRKLLERVVCQDGSGEPDHASAEAGNVKAARGYHRPPGMERAFSVSSRVMKAKASSTLSARWNSSRSLALMVPNSTSASRFRTESQNALP